MGTTCCSDPGIDKKKFNSNTKPGQPSNNVDNSHALNSYVKITDSDIFANIDNKLREHNIISEEFNELYSRLPRNEDGFLSFHPPPNDGRDDKAA